MEKRDTSSTTARSVTGGVQLATPARGFRQQCEDAAETLGFAAPCPTKLPLVKGKPVDCSGPCAVMAGGGETLDMIFFLNVDGYDAAPTSPPVHHMIIEARKVDRAPPSPCAGGAPAGTVEVKGREVTLLDCPPRTPDVDRQIMHGEGAHVEHVLGSWDDHGIRYVASVHGATDSNTSLLEQVIASIEILEP